jgi:hypothetical protein
VIRRVVTFATLLVAANGAGLRPLHAQRARVVDPGPELVSRTVQARLESGAAIVLGDSLRTFSRDTAITGSAVVFARRVVLEGRVNGDLIVIGGDLFVHPGARIDGRAIAIGGAVYPSRLAIVAGGAESYRDFTYDVTRVGDVLELRYRTLIAPSRPTFSLPGLSAIRVPSYDRTNGLSLPVGPLVSLARGRIEIDPRVTYRSQLGEFDPSVDAAARLTRRVRVSGSVERGTFSNDEWIATTPINSLRAVLTGQDTRNYFRADRGELRLHRLWDWPDAVLEPFAGARLERGWSVRPDSFATGGPWSVLGRRSRRGMWRPNPRVDDGHRVASGLLGAIATFERGTFRASGDALIEAALVGDDPARWVQTTVDGSVRFPTFRDHQFRTDVHVVLTAGGPAPRQRWAYLGGSGTIPSIDLLELGGDQLFLVDSRYEIPLPRFALPIAGPPVLSIRNVLGGAAAGAFPALVEMIGLRLSVAVLRAEVLMDTRSRRPIFRAGIGLTR